jgi:Cft2 family RNA processing exonuclease
MDAETPGHIVANSKKGEKIKLTEAEKEIEVKCEIKNLKFSAHSKREELLEIVNRLKPEKIVLVHGDKEAINWVGASIIKLQKGKKVYSAAVGKKISFD